MPCCPGDCYVLLGSNNRFYKFLTIWKFNIYLLKAVLSSHSNTLPNVRFCLCGRLFGVLLLDSVFLFPAVVFFLVPSVLYVYIQAICPLSISMNVAHKSCSHLLLLIAELQRLKSKQANKTKQKNTCSLTTTFSVHLQGQQPNG